MVAVELASAFLLGVATPLTAVCVLPLYPGFLAFLADRIEPETDLAMVDLGGLVLAGVVTFMLLTGLLVSTVLELSLSRTIASVAPIGFGLLAVFGVVLLFDLDLGSRLPSFRAPRFDSPRLDAFGFGFFFGLIALPCNPAFIGALFARSLLVQSPVLNLARFVSFGVGMGFPLLLLAAVSDQWRTRTTRLLTRYKPVINRGSGLIMLGIAAYYLFIVFQVVPLP